MGKKLIKTTIVRWRVEYPLNKNYLGENTEAQIVALELDTKNDPYAILEEFEGVATLDSGDLSIEVDVVTVEDSQSKSEL